MGLESWDMFGGFFECWSTKGIRGCFEQNDIFYEVQNRNAFINLQFNFKYKSVLLKLKFQYSCNTGLLSVMIVLQPPKLVVVFLRYRVIYKKVGLFRNHPVISFVDQNLKNHPNMSQDSKPMK